MSIIIFAGDKNYHGVKIKTKMIVFKTNFYYFSTNRDLISLSKILTFNLNFSYFVSFGFFSFSV